MILKTTLLKYILGFYKMLHKRRIYDIHTFITTIPAGYYKLLPRGGFQYQELLDEVSE